VTDSLGTEKKDLATVERARIIGVKRPALVHPHGIFYDYD